MHAYKIVLLVSAATALVSWFTPPSIDLQDMPASESATAIAWHEPKIPRLLRQDFKRSYKILAQKNIWGGTKKETSTPGNDIDAASNNPLLIGTVQDRHGAWAILLPKKDGLAHRVQPGYTFPDGTVLEKILPYGIEMQTGDSNKMEQLFDEQK